MRIGTHLVASDRRGLHRAPLFLHAPHGRRRLRPLFRWNARVHWWRDRAKMAECNPYRNRPPRTHFHYPPHRLLRLAEHDAENRNWNDVG